MFFLHGGGANGKSTFLDVLTGCLGGYARSAPMETFVASNSDRHPTELAMLRGARLVSAVETEEGRRWAESRIKALTGSDQITARFMRADFFTFTPRFKLLVIGNHKPRLVCVDEAMRRMAKRMLRDRAGLLRDANPAVQLVEDLREVGRVPGGRAIKL